MDKDIHEAKAKLKRIFCNSNVHFELIQLKKILSKVPPISDYYLDD